MILRAPPLRASASPREIPPRQCSARETAQDKAPATSPCSLLCGEKVVAYNALVLRHPFSGVEKAVAGLGRALAARAVFDYRVLLPAGTAVPSWAPPAHPSLRVPPWCRGRFGRILYELSLLPCHLRLAGIDLLHAPAYVAPPRLRCPLVLSIYDLHVHTHPRFCTRANLLHYRARLPGSIRRAAAIIVPSQATLGELERLYPEARGKTRIIPLGLDPVFFDSCPPERLAEVCARHRLPASFLLFVGDLTPRKNPKGIVGAWQSLRACHSGLGLVIAGDRAAGMELPPLEGLVRTGYVDEADLTALYALAAALVFPSFDEGFGLPVLEAMACGCPVVCTGGAAREFAGDAARYCDPADPADIAAQTLPLLLDDSLRAAQIQRGRSQASLFTWDRAAAATEAVYREALS